MRITKTEAAQGKETLYHIFRRVEKYLWFQDIAPGLPRFRMLANILFLKLMHERGQAGFWESLKDAPDKAACLNGVILPALEAQYDAQGVFFETHALQKIAIQKIVTVLDGYRLSSIDLDIIGEAYEYFLKKQSASKQSLGQYFTPRPLARVMAGLACPTRDETVYDPFCGAGGLLVEAFSHIIKDAGHPDGKSVFAGKDASPDAVRIAKMNAILHWGDHSGIEFVPNTLEHPVYGKYDIGLGNVPFAKDPKNYQYDSLYENGLARKKTDVLCILHLFQSIRQGGRLVAIVPEGFLCGIERAEARRFLTDNANLRLVVSLPHGIFHPYTNVGTALIYLDNVRCPKPQDHFWYGEIDGLNSLQGGNSQARLSQARLFQGASEERLTSSGFIRVPFEKVRHNKETWLGRHYEDSHARSPYPLVPLGDLVTFHQTGFSYRGAHLSDSGIPLFTLNSVKKDFFPHYESQYLKYETQTTEKNACVKGDILIAVRDKNIRSAIIGKATIANSNGVFSSDLVKVSIASANLLSSEYLYYIFKNEIYAREIGKFSVGTIAKSINLENMASIKIPLPPLTVQKQIVSDFNRYEKLNIAQNEAANSLQEKCRERLRSLWA